MSPVFGHGGLRLYLLKLLDEQPRHGYDVIRLLEHRFAGRYAPSAGTVYPRLARLEAAGLVEHEESEGRKVYRLTDAGRRELAERATEVERLEASISGSAALAQEIRADVRASVRDLRAELRQAARAAREGGRSPREGQRAAGREAGRGAGDRDRWPGSSRAAALEIQRELEAVGRELAAAARRADPDPERLARVREVLERTRREVLRALAGEEAGDGGAG